jgi:maleylpyruvate isomerase
MTLRKNTRSLTSDLNVLQRESGMAMATIASLTEDELAKPTHCEGWTRAHLIAHLALDADATANLVTWAVTGQETPAYESREKRDADIDATAELSAAELVKTLEQAEARLLEGFRSLRDGVQVETVPTPFSGDVNVFSLPALRTTEIIVHHDDLDTTWEWHEADPDATVDAIEVCVHRLQEHPDSPGLQIVALEGEEWTVGDGTHRIEGYYEALLPFLAREQVEEGLRHEGDLPRLPPW